MPRDASGIYTLPAPGNPVVTNTIISSVWANTTLSDIAAQLNNVFTRDGLLGPTAPFKIMDGTVAAPGLAWNSEPGNGWYRPGAGNISMAVGGQSVLSHDNANAAMHAMYIGPRAAGEGRLTIGNNSAGSANKSAVYLSVLADGNASLQTAGVGTGLAGNINFLSKGAFNFSPLAGAGPSVDVTVNAQANGSASLVLNKNGAGQGNNLWGRNNGVNRWVTVLGTADAESGGNNGSHWQVIRYDDAGAPIEGAVMIRRDTGQTSFTRMVVVQNGGVDITGDSVIRGTTYVNPGSLVVQAGGASVTQGLYSDAGYGGWVLQSSNYTGGSTRIVNNYSSNSIGDQSYWVTHHQPGVDTRFIWVVGGSGHQMQFNNGGTLQISGNGIKPGGGMWGDSNSDARVKTAIVDFSDYEFIDQIRPRYYEFREGTGLEGKRYLGAIYQEAPAIMQTKAINTKLGEFEYEDMGSIDQTPIVWGLVNYVRKLKARIEQLEAP